MAYREITCKTAMNKLKKSRLPYLYDLNIYRGCAHGCRYCFALYSHQYMGSADFYGDIFVKTNVVEQLEKQLKSPRWQGEVINIGGVTDSYQPAEAEYCLMPQILELMIKYRNPIILSTKSDLILRDFDLIDKLASLTYVNVASTITTADESLRQKLEPGGVSSQRRFAMLEAFSATKASRGLHVMPVIPFLTDSRQNLEQLFQRGRESKVSYLLAEPLNLRGRARYVFFAFLREHYPLYLRGLEELYQSGRLDREYLFQLYQLLAELRKSYGLTANCLGPQKARLKELLPARDGQDEAGGQLSLF